MTATVHVHILHVPHCGDHVPTPGITLTTSQAIFATAPQLRPQEFMMDGVSLNDAMDLSGFDTMTSNQRSAIRDEVNFASASAETAIRALSPTNDDVDLLQAVRKQIEQRELPADPETSRLVEIERLLLFKTIDLVILGAIGPGGTTPLHKCADMFKKRLHAIMVKIGTLPPA